MKIQYIVLLILILGMQLLQAEEGSDKKSEETSTAITVDPLLDPLYYVLNYTSIIRKRTPLLRQRKGEVPEKIWMLQTDHTITCKPVVYNDVVVVGTASGRISYANLQTGALQKNRCLTGSTLAFVDVWVGSQVRAMSWVGTLTQYLYGLESRLSQNALTFKSKDNHPVGAMSWLGGMIVTRRDDFPAYVNMDTRQFDGKVERSWMGGEATAPVVYAGKDFWFATSKGELISLDHKISQVSTILRLKKSYATALAVEGSQLFALNAEGELYAFDHLAGLPQWQTKLESAGVNSMICKEGMIYVNAGKFYVIDAKHGGIILERDSKAHEKFKRTKPVVTKNRIYTCDSDGIIYIFDKEKKELLQTINLDEDVYIDFVYDSNVLYVPTILSHLYAIDVSLY